MHPLPGQPLPEGWIYIEHPEVGRAPNPVHRSSLAAWGRNGWAECEGPDVIPDVAPDARHPGQVDAPQAATVPDANASSATTSPSPVRVTSMTSADQASTQKAKE
jgi:hypothetical protein